MTKNNKKEKHIGIPIEKQNTAAWANIESQQPVSKVPIPNFHQVENAKEWVDSNQK
ncbi:DUF3787 domain-containing protein [Proteiniborus sp. MB09-C3]|uniref:DUF3787 domain-containing protein n=1 Tax=Proteiniborus sp. MB09-C3 TaxID=3050072 RepID=UPI0025553A95|nr:DUF3787 domain-containing protein [Proteiniborus sp. MB09-C3]WIV11632.1 DUF3787 domain-containing protein [Proteiniborus sp. MB09-C3]